MALDNKIDETLSLQQSATNSRLPDTSSILTDALETTEHGPLRIFIFDAQRTSAQLFSRQLLSHLQFGCISNPCALAATLGPERIHLKLDNNQQAKESWEEQVSTAPRHVSSLTYHNATVKFLREADRLEQQGKILFVREHSPLVMKHDIVLSSLHNPESPVPNYMNPTVLPEELLQAITPIIFIRHPARVIPAWLREANSRNGHYTVEDDDLTLWTSARWSRMLFDYFRASRKSERSGPRTKKARADSVTSHRTSELPMATSWPVVIDAADVVNNTHAILSTLFRLLHLDVQGVQDAWSPGTKFERAIELVKKTISENLMRAFSERLSNTSSVQSEYDIDLDIEQQTWTQEFGEEIATGFRRKVEDDMPHYNYLRSFKLYVPPSVSETTFRQNVFGVPLSPHSLINGPISSIWMSGEKPSRTAHAEICRSASMGQMPMGIMS